MYPTQITPASTAPHDPTEDTMTSTTAPLTSAQLRAARGVTYDAPISAYVGEVWVDPWAMAAADEVVTRHDDDLLTDAEFDDQLSAIIATERQAEIVAPEIIEPDGEFILNDDLLDLACEIESAVLHAETDIPASGLMADIEATDWGTAPWSHTMGYSAEMIDRLAVESAHRQSEREEMEALWREQERMDELAQLDFSGLAPVVPEYDFSSLYEDVAA